MMHSFVEIYQNALDSSFCQRCIDKFENSAHRIAGRTGQGVDAKKKNSTDITLNNCLGEWQEELPYLQQAVLRHLIEYVRKYPFMLAGAISLQHQGPDGAVKDLEYTDIENMDQATLGKLIMAVYHLGTINLQKYDRGTGGYFHWHSEHYPHPRDRANGSLHRVLLWMFYLNDVKAGGETEFYYQEQKVRPGQGTMVIAPSTFTHTHRGAMPVSNDKYIFTSWILYQPAEVLYGEKR